MKNAITYNVAFGCIITLFSCYSFAQGKKSPIMNVTETPETYKRIDNYLELKNLGYKEQEIFEDLGNANFLVENYETALFWYRKLRDISEDGKLTTSYRERYTYALHKTGESDVASVSNKDWFAAIKQDYQINDGLADRRFHSPVASQYPDLKQKIAAQFNLKPSKDADNEYDAPIAVSTDGNTAYFSMSTLVKPMYGVFSKKQLVHKIYKVEKVEGQWKNIQEVALSPKYSSAKHPAISADGKRLFFASDMPGTFGKFDIYVAEIQSDGSLGTAKNLGRKVNTDKDDLYPSILSGNTLCFASEGHKGFGGLDLFMAQVDHQTVGRPVNLGAAINSLADDFSISVSENGLGYVMSNRGENRETVQRVAFTNTIRTTAQEKHGDIFEILNSNSKMDYTSSHFEND